MHIWHILCRKRKQNWFHFHICWKEWSCTFVKKTNKQKQTKKNQETTRKCHICEMSARGFLSYLINCILWLNTWVSNLAVFVLILLWLQESSVGSDFDGEKKKGDHNAVCRTSSAKTVDPNGKFISHFLFHVKRSIIIYYGISNWHFIISAL